MSRRLGIVAVTTLVVLFVQSARAVDVRVEFDKAFDFKAVKTWAWNPSRPGEIKMARTADDDPDAVRKRAEPIILDAMTMEMGRRKLQMAADQPDLTVTYYLLLTTSASSQTMGQFLPATAAWGLPPFAPATQSLQVMNRGSFVLDLSAKGTVVWRGVAQTDYKMDATERQRETLLREAVRDLLRRYPTS
jgi:hypothetical protein